MLLRASDHKNMHVSDFPEMCLFTTELVYPDPDMPDSGKVIVAFNPPADTSDGSKAEPKTLEVPLQPSHAHLSTVDIVMHSSPTKGYNMGDTYNSWFSACIGYDVILVDSGGNRREILGNVPPNAAGKNSPAANTKGSLWLSNMASNIPFVNSYAGVDEGIMFADCAPFLVVTERSWENAQSRLPENETLDITKFRPNIVVAGAEEEFEEDYWAELAVGDKLKIVLTANCARCTSLNVDYATGKVGAGESGKILKKLQGDRRVDKGAKYSPIFGRYGFLDKMPVGSKLKVGDEVTVAKRNAERSRLGKWRFRLEPLCDDSDVLIALVNSVAELEYRFVINTKGIPSPCSQHTVMFRHVISLSPSIFCSALSGFDHVFIFFFAYLLLSERCETTLHP
jgi:uncharacterized protein YcbX